nr:hypothetical protein [Bacillus pumilus]
MVEDVDFGFDFCTGFEIGFKAVGVNVSDMGGMGGGAKYYVV